MTNPVKNFEFQVTSELGKEFYRRQIERTYQIALLKLWLVQPHTPPWQIRNSGLQSDFKNVLKP